MDLECSCFSVSERATFLLSFSSLSLSTRQHREFLSGALTQTWSGQSKLLYLEKLYSRKKKREEKS
jgi:hypothetical protein